MTRLLGPEFVDVVVDGHAEVGEGPVWDDATGRLLWVDIPVGAIHLQSDGVVDTIDVGQPVGAVAVRRSGGLVAAVRDGFALIDVAHAAVEVVAPVEKHIARNRMNDGKCDPAGRFWAGTMEVDMAPDAGALYVLDAELVVDRVLGDVSVSNGLAWDHAATTMYFVDSGAGGVDAFDFDLDTGHLARRRRVVDVPACQGLPDGMTIDGDGCLWVAVWGAGEVRRYTPAGRLDATLSLPTAQVTSATFGGRDLDILFVTTAARGLSDGDQQAQPHAGALFGAHVGVAGVPADTFAG